jgi:signal transduction histidine kinase
MLLIRDATEAVLFDRNKNEKYYQEMLLLSASHELRTPLNANLQMGELLEPYITDPEGLSYLRILRNSSKLMLILVNDMLDLYQIKANQLRLIPTEFVLNDLIESCLETFVVQAQHKSVNLFFEI